MKASAPDLFRRRTAIALAAVAAVSLAAALVLSAIAPHESPESTAGTAFSKSAVGYDALVQFLRKEGLGVVVSRSGTALKTNEETPLLLLEPPAHGGDAARLVTDATSRGARVVIVAPKWSSAPSRDKPGWIARAWLRDPEDVHTALANANLDARVVRPDTATECAGAPGLVLAKPQLVLGETLTPLVSCKEGFLVARAPGGEFVVADPDLVNTAGLGRGQNAEIIRHLVVEVIGAKGVVVDETVHGFNHAPSIWAELFDFPLALVTLHLAAVALLVVWAAFGRFGKAVPLPPRVAPGKRALIENTAALLGYGGHAAHALRRYLTLTLREGAAACALPPSDDDAALAARLDVVARARGVGRDVRALAAEVGALAPTADPRKVLALGRELYRWRKELAGGS